MKQTVSISVDDWLYNWMRGQKQGGYNLSRLIVRAVINYYHLAPPDIEEIERKIKENWHTKKQK